jgi:hypothetical protein
VWIYVGVIAGVLVLLFNILVIVILARAAPGAHGHESRSSRELPIRADSPMAYED